MNAPRGGLRLFLTHILQYHTELITRQPRDGATLATHGKPRRHGT